jgi:AcrR family transcriptional regulator
VASSLRRSLTNWIVTPDRIAEQAKANKRLIYVDLGNKEQLFETVVGRALGELADAVPFTPDDLPGYASALFGHLIGRPQLMRPGTWRQLERPEVVAATDDGTGRPARFAQSAVAASLAAASSSLSRRSMSSPSIGRPK